MDWKCKLHDELMSQKSVEIFGDMMHFGEIFMHFLKFSFKNEVMEKPLFGEKYFWIGIALSPTKGPWRKIQFGHQKSDF